MNHPFEIEQALREAFITIEGVDSNTLFENAKFDPANRKWYAFWFLPNVPKVASLGMDGTDHFDGIVQIDLNIDCNDGQSGRPQFETALRSLFTAGARFSFNSATAIIKSCGQVGTGRKIDGFYRFSYHIVFESRLSRKQ